MTARTYGFTIFCDDVRQEVGNKFTYVGCYSAVMLLLSEYPITLPVFHAVLNLRMPVTRQFKGIRLVVVKVVDDSSETLSEALIEQEGEHLSADEGEKDNSDVDRQISMFMTMRFAPLKFDSDCTLKVRAYIDDEEVRMGTLQIRRADSEADLTSSN